MPVDRELLHIMRRAHEANDEWPTAETLAEVTNYPIEYMRAVFEKLRRLGHAHEKNSRWRPGFVTTKG